MSKKRSQGLTQLAVASYNFIDIFSKSLNHVKLQRHPLILTPPCIYKNVKLGIYIFVEDLNQALQDVLGMI